MFRSTYTDSLREALTIAEMVIAKDPKNKYEWAKMYKECRKELYRINNRIDVKKDLTTFSDNDILRVSENSDDEYTP